jgi:uncharacterized protein (DUF736 family)
MAAGAIPGPIGISTNGGSTWSISSAPSGNWISIDMTLTGSRIIGVQYLGGMYLSNDSGATWSAVSGGALSTSGREYESVTVSTDGSRIAAAIMNGEIQVSSDGGATWTAARAAGTPAGGAALVDQFRAIDSSADGSVVVAATQNNRVYLSTDGGATFQLRPVAVGGTAVGDGWYRVKVSEDGNTIVLAGNYQYTSASSGIYVSRDRGLTWRRGSSDSATYSSISLSANGDIIGVTVSDDGAGGTGRVMLSTNGGVSFAPAATPAGETNWRAMAISGTAGRAVLAAGTFASRNGQVYTSSTLVGP